MMTEAEVDELERSSAEEAPEVELDAEPTPKRRSAPSSTPKRTRRKRGAPPSLKAPLRAMLETVGGVWHMSELTRGHEPLAEDFPTCGQVLVAQADDIATNLNALAQTDPNVYRWLDRMMTGGGWGGVVLACWPVAQAVLQSHVMPAISRSREELPEGEEGEPWSPFGPDQPPT